MQNFILFKSDDDEGDEGAVVNVDHIVTARWDMSISSTIIVMTDGTEIFWGGKPEELVSALVGGDLS